MNNPFKRFFAVAKFYAKQSFAYRFNFIVDLIFYPLYLIINYFVFKSVFAYSGLDTIRGYTLTALMGYYVLEMVVNTFYWTDIDENIANSIRKGKLTEKLLRPMSIVKRHFFGLAGSKSITLMFHIIPLFIIGFLLFRMNATWMSLWFIPIVLLGYIINFFIAFITGIFAFWLKKTSGLISLRRAIIGFLAGAFIPLTFMPVWFQSVSWFLPFQYTRFIPINSFLGAYNNLFALKIIGIEIFWIVGLYGLYLLLWRAGENKYTGVGQ
jgi:ABC-2 type transport system permease protein